MLHAGNRQPSKSSPSEIDPSSPRDAGYRVPRITADLVAARPIHLAVIDGIETVAGGEGPWVQAPPRSSRSADCRHQLREYGCRCTALMGFDPMADRGTAPFENV